MSTQRWIVLSVALVLLAAPAIAEGESCNEFVDCDSTEWCQYPPGICFSEDPLGTCEPKFEACIENWDPVCGCDWQTYTNEACAAVANVSIVYYGECDEPVCGGYLGLLCGTGEFCDLELGQCGIYFGMCETRPAECPAACEPVCGCDGLDYVSGCQANVAGMSALHLGACDSSTDGIVSGLVFGSPGMLSWDTEVGALRYDVYRRVVTPPPADSGWSCYVSDVTQPEASIGDPLPGELWWLQVSVALPTGEGPLGTGSACIPRQVTLACQ